MPTPPAAREQGASGLVMERAPTEEQGGNSGFAIGAIRRNVQQESRRSENAEETP
jgi:hypothetical protein